MRSNRAVPACSAAVIAAALLAGCASDDEVRLAEPELDFPYTSTTAAPTPTTTQTSASETTTASSTTSSSSKSSTSTSTKTSTSTRSAPQNASRNDDDEPAPAPAAPPARVEEQPAPVEPGAACAWPSQNEARDKEFSTFCDREWARTVMPSTEQQYFWRAKGAGWVSIDPNGQAEDGVCWDPKDFEGAPEAIRKAAVFCEPE